MQGATSVLLGVKGLNAGEFIVAVDLHQKGALLHDGPLLPPAVEGQLHLHAVGVDGGEHLGPPQEPVHQQTLVPNLGIGDYIRINIFEYQIFFNCTEGGWLQKLLIPPQSVLNKEQGQHITTEWKFKYKIPSKSKIIFT